MRLKLKDSGVAPIKSGLPRMTTSGKILSLRSRMTTNGFTLIELIVVIAIIGILASIAIGNTFSSIPKAHDAQRKNDLKQMQTALQVYFQDHNSYPQPASSRCQSSTASTLCWIKLFDTIGPNGTTIYGTPTYIKQMPQDPLSTGVYTYCSSSSNQYTLVATLENQHDTDINGNNNCTTTITPNTYYWVTNP